MWNEVVDENDLKCFMNWIGSFHDSCIKELRYISGAYVDEGLSMYPLNDKRILDVIIQRQFKDISMIEMQFIGLKCLKLYPTDEKNTCEIIDSAMFIKDDSIYWCDCGEISENDLEEYEGTLICASKLRWRSIDNSMGPKVFFTSNK